MGQIFWTHRDSGGTQFNYSEVIGNSTAVAISNTYYVNNGTSSDAVSKLGMQLGVDIAANLLKEFWPDLQRNLCENGRDTTAKQVELILLRLAKVGGYRIADALAFLPPHQAVPPLQNPAYCG